MAVHWVRFSLRGVRSEARTGDLLFALLGVTPEDGFPLSPSQSAWQAACVRLLEVAVADLHGFEEPYEEFANRVQTGLRRAADWLSSRPPGAFEQCRAHGLKLDLFVGGWIEGDQFDLSLPPEFLLACGQAGLPIEICTND